MLDKGLVQMMAQAGPQLMKDSPHCQACRSVILSGAIICAGKLLVNFDKGLAQTMAEAKALARLGVALPEGARTVLLQEEKFQVYYETLSHALKVQAPLCLFCSLAAPGVRLIGSGNTAELPAGALQSRRTTFSALLPAYARRASPCCGPACSATAISRGVPWLVRLLT